MPKSSQEKNKEMPKFPDLWKRITIALNTDRTGQIAKMLDLKDPSVSEWKVKGTVPSLENLMIIAKLGNTSIDWLLTGEGDKVVVKQESEIEQAIRRIVREELSNQSNVRSVDTTDKHVVDEWKMTDKDKKSQKKRA